MNLNSGLGLQSTFYLFQPGHELAFQFYVLPFSNGLDSSQTASLEKDEGKAPRCRHRAVEDKPFVLRR